MGHIPEDTEWFVAELIMEIVVEGDPRSVVHRNLTLVRARNPEEAYQAASRWGVEGEASYGNPEGRTIGINSGASRSWMRLFTGWRMVAN